MTLRKLAWMCAEKKRVMGELAAWEIAWIGRLMPFVNAKLDPAAINPYGSGGCSAEVERVKAFIASVGFRVQAEEAAERERRGIPWGRARVTSGPAAPSTSCGRRTRSPAS